jgi:hypothetical protein
LPNLAADSDSDELPGLVEISDDERNRLDRDGPNTRSTFPPPGTYDVRVIQTAFDSADDQQTDSDDEQPDSTLHNPATWYDHTLPNLPLCDRNITQPLTTPPFLSSIEIHQWYRSHMRWRQFLLTLPERHQAAYERRPSPDIRMQEPNRSFMLALPTTHSPRSVDSMDIRARLLHYDSQEPHMTWSTYLRTLHPPAADYYRSFPPLLGDSIANQYLHGRDSWPHPTPPPVPNPIQRISHPHIAGVWTYTNSPRTDRVNSPPKPTTTSVAPQSSTQKGNRLEGYSSQRQATSSTVQKGTRSAGPPANAHPSSPPAQKGKNTNELSPNNPNSASHQPTYHHQYQPRHTTYSFLLPRHTGPTPRQHPT